MKSAELQRYAKQQMTAYREQSDGRCEISRLLRRSELYQRWSFNHCLPALECHHIYSRKHGELSHHFTNLILIENAAHDFAHDGGLREYKPNLAVELCCLCSKLERHIKEFADCDRDGRSYDRPELWHWNRATLGSICGYSTFAYRLEYLADELKSSPFASLSQELLEKVA